MSFKWILLFILALVSYEIHALSGARAVSNGKHQSVGSLYLYDPGVAATHSFCAGVLISPTKVLTAGHCIDVIGLEVYDYALKLVNDPEVLRVKIAGVKHEVKSVTYARSYFEASGFDGEDVAVIELKTKSLATPIPVASSKSLLKYREVTLVAHGKEGDSSLKSIQSINGHRILSLDATKVWACAGDSGGAVMIQNDGRYELAGLILADGEGCERKDTWSIHPSLSTRSL